MLQVNAVNANTKAVCAMPSELDEFNGADTAQTPPSPARSRASVSSVGATASEATLLLPRPVATPVTSRSSTTGTTGAGGGLGAQGKSPAAAWQAPTFLTSTGPAATRVSAVATAAISGFLAAPAVTPAPVRAGWQGGGNEGGAEGSKRSPSVSEPQMLRPPPDHAATGHCSPWGSDSSASAPALEPCAPPPESKLSASGASGPVSSTSTLAVSQALHAAQAAPAHTLQVPSVIARPVVRAAWAPSPRAGTPAPPKPSPVSAAPTHVQDAHLVHPARITTAPVQYAMPRAVAVAVPVPVRQTPIVHPVALPVRAVAVAVPVRAQLPQPQPLTPPPDFGYGQPPTTPAPLTSQPPVAPHPVSYPVVTPAPHQASPAFGSFEALTPRFAAPDLTPLPTSVFGSFEGGSSSKPQTATASQPNPLLNGRSGEGLFCCTSN